MKKIGISEDNEPAFGSLYQIPGNSQNLNPSNISEYHII